MHSVILYFLSVVFIVVGTYIDNGQDVSVNKEAYKARIANGANATIRAYSYNAYVYPPGCGGAILGNKWILTAGQCQSKDKMAVYVASDTKFEGRKVSIKRAQLHPKYKEIVTPHGLRYSHDYMILILEDILYTSNVISYVPIGEYGQIVHRKIAFFTGFGQKQWERPEWRKDDNNAKNSGANNQLRVARISIMSHEHCFYVDNVIHDGEFCAGGNYATACHGDHGSPLVADGKLLGLVTRGIFNTICTGLTVFSSVPYVKPWIDTVMTSVP